MPYMRVGTEKSSDIERDRSTRPRSYDAAQMNDAHLEQVLRLARKLLKIISNSEEGMYAKPHNRNRH